MIQIPMTFESYDMCFTMMGKKGFNVLIQYQHVSYMHSLLLVLPPPPPTAPLLPRVM
jgi:hypothetical protein